MRKKHKNSFRLKVFLWVFASLTFCSMVIYGIVLTVLPKQYQVISDQQLDSNIQNLVSDLQKMTYEDATKEIYNFCIQNNVTAILSDESSATSFGEINTEHLSVATSSIAASVTFLGDMKEYMLVVSSVSQTTDMMYSLMLRFLPVIFGIILFLSSLSALLCSKVIASMERLKRANEALTDDVEKCKELEEQRRNFFAAVSHELKTPLTVLRGQIENMILGYGDYQNHEKYLPEALRATDNIEQLVKEIITISKMESMDLQDTLQEVSLLQTVEDTVQTIMPLAQEKSIHIQQIIHSDKMICVNPSLWNKVLSNVIGNAVQHSPCGETVLITMRSDTCGNMFVVENTGVKISEMDMPQMFTPFYRADKSRSRTTGGSGLGFYIVKTILDLHGMKYGIKNIESGVIFYIYLND